MLNHNYIGTEHVLLGILRQGDSVAVQALESLDISVDQVRTRVEEIIGQGQQPLGEHIPFTPRAKKSLELSLREALQLGYAHVGPEHLLLGLIREGEGIAAQVLVSLGAELTRTRQQVIALLMPEPAPTTALDVSLTGASSSIITAVSEAVAEAYRQYVPTEEMTLHCDAPSCQAQLSMVAGVSRSEHGWGRATFYVDAEATDYDLCAKHFKAILEALWT